MDSHQQQTPPIVFHHHDSLYCEEQHLDNGEIIQNTTPNSCYIQQQQEESSMINPEHFVLWEDEELRSLLDKEQDNELEGGIGIGNLNPFCLVKGRGEAVEWMLKVVGYYSFSALTAVLAVNYFHRFLNSINDQSHSLSHTEKKKKKKKKKKPWMTQLTAVSCLSLAAKVEETHVPLLLDLQVEEYCKYVFESKTIQRMEILILSTLQWKMNPVTPLSFLDYIARRLGLKTYLFREFLSRSESLLLSAISDCRFMCCLPSALATATMLYVISSLEPSIGVEYQQQLIGILGINKGKVEECCRLIQEVATSMNFQLSNKRKFGTTIPGSPKGVVDMSFSSDTSNDSWTISSVSSSPQPLSKKSKS